ncbi:MAG: 5'/3'-nucleotidase SurE [Fidelibacterota bacterium]
MSTHEPLILITNDDGVYSRGIFALHQAIADFGQTIVVAPETEKSAVGHAITISDPIKVRDVDRGNGFSGYAVGGTPADCVKLGVKALLKDRPDIIVSGINRGANVGMSILYSGTVSAATEGVLLGIPSMAVSLDAWVDPVYTYAAKVARRFTEIVLKRGLPPGTALNVNVPGIPENEIRGIRLTRQGQSYYEEEFDRSVDPRRRTYYWMDGRLVESEEEGDLDDAALRHKCVSVTPLHYNLTSHDSMKELTLWDVFDNDRE